MILKMEIGLVINIKYINFGYTYLNFQIILIKILIKIY